MTGAPSVYLESIRAVRPDLAGLPSVLHTRGWDCDAVEVGGAIFKFPKRPEALTRLEREASFLALIGPRVPLAVPRMVLHRTPMLFSEHEAIPGSIVERRHYDALRPDQKDAMANRLADFYAALHAIPLDAARAAGAEPKPGWPDWAEVSARLRARLPEHLHDFAERSFLAHSELPREREVFGYFDGHGWNMAFDHEAGILNGVYDFADAAIGRLSRDFTYSDLTAPDLTDRVLRAYARTTGTLVDRRVVLLRTTVQYLSETADAEGDPSGFAADVVRWCDEARARA